ncbi:MAG: zinc ribbon domain-containing protein [Candidatus Methanofastidiosia archaeon]
MIEYENSFSLKGDIREIYHLTETYFQDQGFTFEVGQEPNRLVFKKKGTRWTTSIKKSSQILYVTLIEDKNTVTIIMTYIFRITGFLSSEGRHRLDSNVTKLENMLILSLQETKNARCSKCGNETPQNANYCNQCGERLDFTRSY